MKLIITFIFFISSSAMANVAFSTVRQQLRLHLWNYGLEEQQLRKVIHKKPLPEEIERAIKKM